MPFTSDKRLLLTENDEVVGADDPRGVKLLVAEGGTVSDEDAVKYGLSGGSVKEEDRDRPKEIRIGGGGSSTAEAMTDEEEINLGDASQKEGVSEPTSEEVDTPKASKKARKKGK